MASGDSLIYFPALSYSPPSTNYANVVFRNTLPCLNFNNTTQQAAVFFGMMPNHYSSGNIKVNVLHASTSTSGILGWTIEMDTVGRKNLNVDVDSYTAPSVITASSVPSTSGQMDIVNVVLVAGSATDYVNAGDFFKIRLKRNVAVDDLIAGNVFGIDIQEA